MVGIFSLSLYLIDDMHRAPSQIKQCLEKYNNKGISPNSAVVGSISDSEF